MLASIQRSQFLVLLGLSSLVAVSASGQVVLSQDFEEGWGSWFADNGVWEVGVPTEGPTDCRNGLQCAGTVLAGTYPENTDSRLVSPALTLPSVATGEEIQISFWTWFSYEPCCDSGHVQVSFFDSGMGTWSDWQTIGAAIGGGDSSVWSLAGRDITGYAGELVRIAFFHTADSSVQQDGWFVDDIQIAKKTPEFSSDFESGWGDWYTDNGIWEVGAPTSGPSACHAGVSCAGTVLGGDYPASSNSRLISPSVTLSRSGADPIELSFFHWFSYEPCCDRGHVQISVYDDQGEEWSGWETLGGDINGSSSIWSPTIRDLTSYDGERVRLAFFHTADGSVQQGGWFVDNVAVSGIVIFSDGFESGDTSAWTATVP